MSQQRLKSLAKMLAYVLGRRPDEFGLIPDAGGYVTVKHLLQALAAESGFSFVRQGHLNQIAVILPKTPIEISGNRIRAVDREHLPSQTVVTDPPKLLYTCVRRRAYPALMKRDCLGPFQSGIVLCSQPEAAELIGRRNDAHPVLLTVSARKARERGVQFSRFGERLYLAPSIPADCFSGPPLPKETTGAEKKDLTDKTVRDQKAGSYQPDPAKIGLPLHSHEARKRKKEIDWKKERRNTSRRRKKRPGD